MQKLVQAGTVNAVIASDIIHISGIETLSEMHRETLRVTGTRLWVRDIGVNPEDCLRLKQDRKLERDEVVEHATCAHGKEGSGRGA